MPVPAEATPQPGERFLPLPSAPSPLGQRLYYVDVDVSYFDIDIDVARIDIY